MLKPGRFGATISVVKKVVRFKGVCEEKTLSVQLKNFHC
jgi:hypothetical protein